ncbi:MAG: glycosyltransferase family 2 protein [Myxococcales bacterium]|nr:glycosyltransferase family 2 protein [Myxococcales bacterium]
MSTWAARRRWPGLDGLVLVALGAVLVLTWLLKGMPEVGWPLVVVLSASASWLAVTSSLRRGPGLQPVAAGVRPVVVIPTHDNAGTIARVVRDCLAHHPHVWVIDDGSSDGSGTLAADAGASVHRHPENLGKGAALLTALQHAHDAGFSHIIAIDADGQHFPDDLPAFLQAIAEAPEAVICGVRDAAATPDGSIWARRNSNFWVWVETGRWLGDTQSGYRAYPVAAVRALHLPPSRYEWEVEVLTRAIWSGVPVRDIPCRVFYPPREQRVSSYRKLWDTARVTWLNVQLVVERILWPPRWFVPAPRSGWQGQHRGTLLGWRFLLAILRLFGRRLCTLAVMPLPVFYWFAAAHLRQGLDAYLRRRFPDAGAVRRGWLAWRIMAQFARSLVDRFALLLWGPSVLQFDPPDVEAARHALYDNDSGVLLITSHMGDPELAAAALRGKSGRTVHVVMYVDPADPYQRLLREHMGELAPKIIALNDGADLASVAAVRALRSGDIVAVKADRVVDGRSLRVPFLGDDVRLPAGPLLLAGLAKAPVVMLGCFREEGRYRVHVSEPVVWGFTSRAQRDADMAQWALQLAGQLEAWCERYPLQWYNFFDPWDDADSDA